MNPFNTTRWVNLYNKQQTFKITGYDSNRDVIKIRGVQAQAMSIEYFYHVFINKDCWVNKNLYQKYLIDITIFTLLDTNDDGKYGEFKKFVRRIFGV